MIKKFYIGKEEGKFEWPYFAYNMTSCDSKRKIVREHINRTTRDVSCAYRLPKIGVGVLYKGNLEKEITVTLIGGEQNIINFENTFQNIKTI